MSDFSQFTDRRARKFHECDICGASVKSGSAYSHGRHLWDGRWGETHRHPVCEAALQSMDLDPWDLAWDGDAQGWRELIENIPSRGDVVSIVAAAALAGADPDALVFWRAVFADQEGNAP